MFSAVKKSLQQIGLSPLFLFLVGLRVNYPGHSYKFEIIGTAEGWFFFFLAIKYNEDTAAASRKWGKLKL